MSEKFNFNDQSKEKSEKIFLIFFSLIYKLKILDPSSCFLLLRFECPEMTGNVKILNFLFIFSSSYNFCMLVDENTIFSISHFQHSNFSLLDTFSPTLKYSTFIFKKDFKTAKKAFLYYSMLMRWNLIIFSSTATLNFSHKAHHPRLKWENNE